MGGVRHPLPSLAVGSRPAIRHATFGDTLGEVDSVERDANGWVVLGWACGKDEQGRQIEVPSAPAHCTLTLFHKCSAKVREGSSALIHSGAPLPSLTAEWVQKLPLITYQKSCF